MSAGGSVRIPKFVPQVCGTIRSFASMYSGSVCLFVSVTPQLTGATIKTDLMTAQKRDAVIRRVIEAVKQGVWPSNKDLDTEMLLMKREVGRLLMRDGLLYRASKKAAEEALQLVLPAEFREVVLHSLHDDMGHLGVERVTQLLRARFYWPKMAHEAEKYVRNCGLCITRKTPAKKAASLHQITSSGPMDLVCIDFLSMEPDSRGISNVLVVTDHYTRYAQAFPAKNQKALTVAKILVEKYFVHYGLPVRIHSDQGRDFESRLIRELLTTLGIMEIRTTPSPLRGPPTERVQPRCLSMLATLGQEKKRSWSQHVASLVHAYNSTKSDATGYSPYYLMFGREARLPVDLCFETSKDGTEERNHFQYVESLKRDLQRAYQLASQAADKTHLRNKRAYDQKRREVSDRVSVSSQYEDAIEPSPVQSAEVLESDIQDDEEGRAVADSDPYDSETDLDAGRNPVHAPKEKLSCKPKVNRNSVRVLNEEKEWTASQHDLATKTLPASSLLGCPFVHRLKKHLSPEPSPAKLLEDVFNHRDRQHRCRWAWTTTTTSTTAALSVPIVIVLMSINLWYELSVTVGHCVLGGQMQSNQRRKTTGV
ncbi:hypothetical protein AALO_G00309360 [Alosa alosa]|uniref:Gypsy retrotransposon integrase-like protein 1 n=1 Tax=Alosa alosa TaxID=278164 RepID=A0AAV6FCJ0_9TELE|nr:hypothetical protein AALO_G00309360 [Alosa alosa]